MALASIRCNLIPHEGHEGTVNRASRRQVLRHGGHGCVLCDFTWRCSDRLEVGRNYGVKEKTILLYLVML